MKKHSSFDHAPDKPFWKTKASKQKSSGDGGCTSTSSSGDCTSSSTVSPSKRVNLRGQCVNQLLQLHQLLEKGGITKEQYDHMKTTIMGEVNKFV